MQVKLIGGSDKQWDKEPKKETVEKLMKDMSISWENVAYFGECFHHKTCTTVAWINLLLNIKKIGARAAH